MPPSLLVVVLLLLAACAPVPPSAALDEGLLRGTVTFPDLRPLPADARVEVQVIDPTISGYPANVFASTTIHAGSLRPPIPFLLVYDPASVKEGVDYLIGARVLAGDDLLYVSQGGETALGAGDARDEIQLAASALPAQAAVPGQLNGTLTWLTRDLLPDNATIAVQLVDRTTQPYTRVSESAFRSSGAQTPISFLITYDPDAIDPARTYALEARISVDGRLAWLTEQPVPVLTRDAPADGVEVPLNRVASSTAATAGNSVVANLVFPAGDVLPIGSTVSVEIIDLAQDAVVASSELRGEGLQSPLAVEIPLSFTPSELRQYVLRARIAGPEEMLYIDEAELPVLTQGAPVTNIAVPLVALAAPVVFATSAATPIAIPTAVAIEGEAPLPGLAPAFPGPTPDPEAADEDDEPAFSGTLTGTVSVQLEPDDAQLDAETVAEILVSLALVVDDEPVTLADTRVAEFGIDEPAAFEVAYEPSLIDAEATYQLSAQALDGEGNLVAESDALPVLTGGNPATEVVLSLVIPVGESETSEGDEEEDASGEEPTPEADQTPQAEATPAGLAGLTESLGSEVVGVIVRFASPDSQSAGTEVRVELRDMTSSAVIAEATADASASGEPVLVRISFSPGEIVATNEYRVFVTVLQDGEPVGFTGRGTEVLTNGAPNAVEIELP